MFLDTRHCVSGLVATNYFGQAGNYLLHFKSLPDLVWMRSKGPITDIWQVRDGLTWLHCQLCPLDVQRGASLCLKCAWVEFTEYFQKNLAPPKECFELFCFYINQSWNVAISVASFHSLSPLPNPHCSHEPRTRGRPTTELILGSVIP